MNCSGVNCLWRKLNSGSFRRIPKRESIPHIVRTQVNELREIEGHIHRDM